MKKEVPKFNRGVIPDNVDVFAIPSREHKGPLTTVGDLIRRSHEQCNEACTTQGNISCDQG
jgi:hypothetical protein